MGDLVDRRIFHIAADPATYQNKQIGFDGSIDADLNFKMVCGRDDVGAITKMLAKDKPARVQSFQILNGQFSWNFDDTGDVGTLSVADSVTSLGKLEFSDDLLTAGGIKARFADTDTEAANFLSDFGDVSLMSALKWLHDNSGALTGLAAEQVLFGNRSGTGEVQQSSALTFNSNSQLLIGTGPDQIGSVANSLFVGGRMEVNNTAYFDETAIFIEGALVNDDKRLFFGSSQNAIIQFSTEQTQRALIIGTGTTSRTLIVTDRDGISPTTHNFSLPAMDDPTIAIMSTDQDNDKSLILSWDRIVGGDTVSVGSSVQLAMAFGNGLTLNGDMDDSLVMGNGTVDADGSLIVGDGLRIGQGDSPHSSAFADTLLAVGDGLTLDASSGFFIGNTINAESHYSCAVGTNITVSHNYADARGRYVRTMANGARHFGMDRYNSASGNAMGIDGLILVGESTGDETIALHDTFSGSDASIVIPDGIMGVFEIEVFSSMYSADSSSSGYRIYSRRIIFWNNAGYSPWKYEAANQVEIASEQAGWAATISAVGNGSGGFNFRIEVSGTSGGTDVITHVARVRGFTSQTSLIASS